MTEQPISPLSSAALLSADVAAQLERLLELRRRLRAERLAASTPAIDHALRLSDVYLHLALGYCGLTTDLCPEEDGGPVPPGPEETAVV